MSIIDFQTHQKCKTIDKDKVIENLINILNLTYRTTYLDDCLDIRFSRRPGIHCSTIDKESFPHKDVMFVFENSKTNIIIHFNIEAFVKNIENEIIISGKMKDQLFNILNSPDGLAMEFAHYYAPHISRVKQKTYKMSLELMKQLKE